MAIVNPSTLYSGGNVKLDSSPYTNFLIKSLQMKQAKDDAFAKYYGDLASKVTPGGMHPDDIPGFIQKKNDWQSYVMQNKDQIQNPSKDMGVAYREANAKFNDLLGYTDTSKYKVQNLMSAKTMLDNPEIRDRIKDLTPIHNAGLPISDPNYKPLELGSVDFNPKEYSAKDWQAYQNDFGKGVKPDKTIISDRPHPTDSFKQIETTQSMYSPNSLKGFVSEAKNDYYNDKSLQYSFDKSHPFKQWSDEHAQEFDRLNNIYKPLAGHDITDNSDLHAAMMVSRKMSPDITEKPVINEEKMQKAATGRTMINVYGAGGANGKATGNAFDDMKDADYSNFKVSGGVLYNTDGTPKTGQIFMTGDVIPTTIKSALKAGGINPDYLNRGVDADVKDGKITSISNKQIGTITRDAMEGVYQPKMDTKPLKSSQHLKFSDQQGSGSYLIKGKTYSEKQLLDMGYKINDIAPYKQK